MIIIDDDDDDDDDDDNVYSIKTKNNPEKKLLNYISCYCT